MNPILERELQKLGLSDKETKVYLAALELGAQAVQDIARKAGVNRATTYVMIESLTQKGLMTSFERGKKRLFNAEAPDRLLSLIRVQQHQLQEQEREFMQVLPELRAVLAASGERPRVRFFEGVDGLRAIREEVLEAEVSEMWTVLDIHSPEMAGVFSAEENAAYDRRLREKGIRGRVMYSGALPSASQTQTHFEFRAAPEDFPISGEVTILGGKIFAFTQHGKVIGAIIESEELAKTIKSIIALAWHSAAQRGTAASPAPSAST